MKHKRKGIILILIAAVLIIIGVIALLIEPNNTEKKESNVVTPKEAEEYVKKICDTIINGGTKKELKNQLQTNDLLETDILTGEDMYLLQTPKKEIMKNENLDTYKNTSKELAKNLEKAIQDNFELNIEGTADEEDYIGVLITYKSYYYKAYINDLTQIQNELLLKKGYQLDDPNFESTNQFEIDKYKAKVKAASILNSHLNDYINTTETNKIYVNFTDKKIKKSSDSFMSLLMNIEGYTYTFQGKLTTVEETLLYIGTVDEKDPLSIE